MASAADRSYRIDCNEKCNLMSYIDVYQVQVIIIEVYLLPIYVVKVKQNHKKRAKIFVINIILCHKFFWIIHLSF